jgi:hypothetical protein
LRTSTVVKLVGAMVFAVVVVVEPLLGEVEALFPLGILGALLTNVPLGLMLLMIGLLEGAVAATAADAKANAIAAASVAAGSWRIAISW